MTELADWSRVKTSDGALLIHPAGDHRGLVRIRRGRRLRGFRAVLAEVLERSPARLAGASCGGVRSLVTAEGEYAMLATLRNRFADGGVLERLVAVVTGDGVAVQLEGFAGGGGDDASFARDFEALVSACVTGAEPLRRRLFEYQPPRGWRPLRRSLSTLWLAPDVPRDPASIEVHDAIPTGDRGAELTHRLLGRPDSGASLTDGRFRYVVDVCDPDGRHGGVAGALVASIKFLPEPTADLSGAAVPFEWVL